MPAPTVAVTVKLSSLIGEAIEGATVKAKLDRYEAYQQIVVADDVTGTSDANGECVLNLFPNALPTNDPPGLGSQGSVYYVSITGTGGKKVNVQAVIPNQACDLHDVIVTEEPGAPSTGEIVGAVRYNIAQSLSSPQQAQARANIGFDAAVRAVALTGLSLATATAIAATDTALVAFGKAQAQITALDTAKANLTGAAFSGAVSATSFTGPLTGNASTATTLATARNINGVSFNGSADITVTAAAGTLTGATLAAGVTASSLTSVGTLTALTVSGQASFAAGSAAAPSVKVGTGNEGLYSLASGTLGLAASGRLALRLETVTNSVNYLYGYANVTGGVPTLRSIGSDTNVGLGLGTQGTGAFAFYSHGATTLQFLVASPANAVNYLQASGAATGGFVTLTATGTDTNVNAAYVTKGVGSHFYYSGSAPLFAIASGGAAGVNYLQVQGALTGAGPVLIAQGPDTNVNLTIASKGSGNVGLYTGAGAVPTFFATHTASGVNWIQVASGAAGGAPSLSVGGSDTNISFAHYTKGTGSHQFFANGGLQLLIGAPASSVNYWQFFGAAAAGALNMYADGADANIAVVQNTKGTGSHFFRTNGGAQTQLLVSHTASAVNYAQITGAATGNAPVLSVAGSDTNIGLSVNTKGTGPMRVLLNSVEAARFSTASTLGAYWDFKYVSGTNEMKVYTAGGAANLGFSSSGGGEIRFYTNDALENQVLIARTANAVNHLSLTGSATGNAVTASAAGTDSNIDFAITPKGTGVLRFGTHSAIGAETVTGFITIKDTGGTTRKLAVLS